MSMRYGDERKVWIYGVTVLHDYPSDDRDYALDGAFVLTYAELGRSRITILGALTFSMKSRSSIAVLSSLSRNLCYVSIVTKINILLTGSSTLFSAIALLQSSDLVFGEQVACASCFRQSRLRNASSRRTIAFRISSACAPLHIQRSK